MYCWSKYIKVRDRENALDLIQWRGNESVLDVGCGRGLMLIGAAQRLTTGRAVGIDTWEAKDLSDNFSQAATDNAQKAGVQSKVTVQTADARALPFADSSFDVVVSHTVIHNIPDASDRYKALSEIVRVLRPGGQLILCDIEHRDVYLNTLVSLGLQNCAMKFGLISDKVFGILSFGSFRPTTIVASKPA
jgi:arsenite methyltransferase